MANFDCGAGSTLFASNFGGPLGTFVNVSRGPAGTPTLSQAIFSSTHQTIQIYCEGLIVTTSGGTPTPSTFLGPAPNIPVQDMLLGLAGIVCASLLAYVFIK